MKKFFNKATFMVVALFSVLMFASCDNDDDVSASYTDLPTTSQTFITQYFPSLNILHIKIDKDNGLRTYEVTFTNGTEVDFNKSGDWTEVDCKTTSIPTGILPTEVTTYITTKYPNAIAYKVDKDYGVYEVSLNNGLELYFSYDGTYIGTEID